MDAAVNLYNNKTVWEQAQSHATHHLQHQFNGETLAKKLIANIKQVQQNLVLHRQDNFTGAMLKHHTMMSTKYMSQWIMEKNKTS